ncbi:hypothetical protein [uncultured Sulfitobacter sp.]|uniref:hypothetical protein n=1 Tax=uncultured Sulfitobacter sp. TaxID=191468 RepID=UPI002619B0E1|nr:hypothetical protein [uncultured Sulfitobacter sp.]
MYWVLILIWVLSIASRFFFVDVDIDGFRYQAWLTGEHYRDLAHGVWGLQYFGLHILAELCVVIWVASALNNRIDKAKKHSLLLPLFGLIVLVGIHTSSFRWDSGYILQANISGDKHVVPWRYAPYLQYAQTGKPQLKISLELPGYHAKHGQRPPRENSLLLRVIKSKDTSIFERPRPSIEKATCIKEIANRYCGFSSDGFAYLVHHRTGRPGSIHLYPTLEDLQQEIPLVFDSFIKQ